MIRSRLRARQRSPSSAFLGIPRGRCFRGGTGVRPRLLPSAPTPTAPDPPFSHGPPSGATTTAPTATPTRTGAAGAAKALPKRRGPRLDRLYHHRASGYLAGLHSYKPSEGGGGDDDRGAAGDNGNDNGNDNDNGNHFDTFESAWEAIQSVPRELLDDFEDELWETQSRRFVHGTKTVSVLDAVETAGAERAPGGHRGDPATQRVVRYLVLNERPNLVQTAVEVPAVGAPYHHYYYHPAARDGAGGRGGDNGPVRGPLLSRPPPPVSETHLGGLAMALPFWYKANGGAAAASPPSCLLIGAGGCSLAHALAADLFLGAFNHRTASAASDHDETSAPGGPRPNGDRSPRNAPVLRAVEACPEILRASELWFGAEARNGGAGIAPPFFDLVRATGESYLRSLVDRSETGTNDDDDTTNTNTTTNNNPPIDVLIIDAEDGSAPPGSMRTPGFWKEAVLPSLNRSCHSSPVVGVNAIGTRAETLELVRTLRDAFRGSGGPGDHEVLVVSPPPEACVTDRHKLVFAIPSKLLPGDAAGSAAPPAVLSGDDLGGLVDAPWAWEEQLRTAAEAANSANATRHDNDNGAVRRRPRVNLP